MFDPAMVLAFVLGFALAVVIVALLGRAPGTLVPLFRALMRPFRVIARRFRGRRGEFSQTASEGTSTLARRTGETEIEAALAVPDDDGSERYDFAAEKHGLKRTGLFFRSIRATSDYLPAHLTGPLTDEVGNFYEAEASKFFAVKVRIDANPASLYEDAEGAFIAGLFKRVDRRCFYFLNETRKTVNDNVRRLVLWLTAVLYLWAFYASIAFARIAVIAAHGPDAANESVRLLIGPALAFVVAVGLLFVIHANGYRQQQRHSMRELRSFLTLYLGRIADRYRETTGNAKQVTVGAETNSAKLAEAAKKWHKTLIWMPFRTFFIECFVRNVLYQINRNSGYYLWLPPLAVGALLLLLAYGMGASMWFALDHAAVAMAYGPLTLSGAVLALMLAILIYFYFGRIRDAVLKEEIANLDWLGFDYLDVSSVMDEVVGKYAEDIGFWKQRSPRN